MYTKDELIRHLKKSNTNPKGTIMVHSSMRAIGQVDGGADTVIDALCNFMDEGLLLFPTHSWDEGNLKEDTYNVATEKSCVGLLTNIFSVPRGCGAFFAPDTFCSSLWEKKSRIYK